MATSSSTSYRTAVAVSVLSTAALTAVGALLVASEARIAGLREAWSLPEAIVYSPEGSLQLRDTLEVIRTIPEVVAQDHFPPAAAAMFKEAHLAYPEPIRAELNAHRVDWYRVQGARTASGGSVAVLAVGNVFPFAVKPYWLNVPRDLLHRWLEDPLGVLVSPTVLRRLGAKVGDRITLSTKSGPLEFHIVSEYEGAMPDYVVAHWQYLDDHASERERGQVTVVAVPPVMASSEQLTAALYRALANAGRTAVVERVDVKLGAEIDSSSKPTRVLRLLCPPLLFTLGLGCALAASVLSTRRRWLWSGLGLGVLAGIGACLFGARDGVKLGVWAFESVRLRPFDLACGVGIAALPAFVGAFASVARVRYALAALGVMAVTGGLTALTMLHASRSALFDASQVPPDLVRLTLPPMPSEQLERTVQAAAGASGAVPLDGEFRSATELVTSIGLPVSGGAVDTYSVRGVDPASLVVHPAVHLGGWDRGAPFPTDGAWLSSRLLRRFGKQPGESLQLLGRPFRIVGTLDAAGSYLESEVWCARPLLETLVVASGHEVTVRVKPEQAEGFLAAARSLPNRPEVAREVDGVAQGRETFFSPSVVSWSKWLSGALALALVLVLVAARTSGAVIAPARSALGLLVIAAASMAVVWVALSRTDFYFNRALLQPCLTARAAAILLAVMICVISACSAVLPSQRR